MARGTPELHAELSQGPVESRMNYYNEHNPKKAAWLRQLIKEGLIPNGEVDERDIQKVEPSELTRFTQCHFFAGVGGWSYALRLAGWPDAKPVWSGSCPCQPFSVAGKADTVGDERHLWPPFYRLITQCNPPVTFGEQVASKSGREWISGIRVDLERVGYAVGAADLCAAGVGSPHIRQRLYWVADTAGARRDGTKQGAESEARDETRLLVSGASSGACGMANASAERCERRENAVRPTCEDEAERREGLPDPQCSGGTSGMGDSNGARLQGRVECNGREGELPARTPSAWSNYDLIPCRDGKKRRVESGTFPLAHGVPERMVRLSGYGDAIVPQVAQVFIEAYLDVMNL